MVVSLTCQKIPISFIFFNVDSRGGTREGLAMQSGANDYGDDVPYYGNDDFAGNSNYGANDYGATHDQ